MVGKDGKKSDNVSGVNQILAGMNPNMINMDYPGMMMGMWMFVVTLIASIATLIRSFSLELYPTSIAAGLSIVYLIVVLFKVVIPTWREVRKKPMFDI